MKKCAAVCGILFAVLFVCFAVSVAATGINSEGFRVAVYGFGSFFPFDDIPLDVYHTNEEYVANLAESDTVTKIDLGVSSSHVTITTAKEADMISVHYKAGRSGIRFGCSIRNGTLIVRENGFFMTLFDWGGDPSELELVLPEREYEKINLSAASGSISAAELVSGKFTAEFASGSGNFSVFADEIRLSASSGSVALKNCRPDRKASSIRLDSLSGNHTVEGFLSDEFDIDLASGVVTLTGISGKGNVDLASGHVQLDYALWDNDLDIDAASGKVEVRLPAESGAFVELDAASGGVSAELDGENASFRGDSSGKVGGGNMHRIDVDLASGSVKLMNLPDGETAESGTPAQNHNENEEEKE